MSELYFSYIAPLTSYLMRDLIGGPRTLQMRHVVNLQKGSSFIVMLSLMFWYDNWSWEACVYLARTYMAFVSYCTIEQTILVHGSYGITWILKDIVIRDKAWDVYITWPSVFVVGATLLGYWSPGFIIISQSIHVSPIRGCLCIYLHTIGVMLMMCADTQKYFTLKYKKGLISYVSTIASMIELLL